MEFVGQPSPSGACSFLGVPGLSCLDVDDDEGEVVIGIRPKSSPLPRRKSSVTDEDSEPEPPPCGSRRVSFADAKGLSLVQVKEFDTWEVPKLPGYDSSEGNGNNAEEYCLSPITFTLPLETKELSAKVRDQKVELESIELLPGTTIVKGVIRVLNISFTKAVYIRTSLDSWSTHFDLLAEYIPSSSDGLTDCFSFKLTLVPPFGEQGARVDFCLRYETSMGTFWANNNNRNYVLFCYHRRKEDKEKPQKETVNKKSCLKAVGQNFSSEETVSSPQENISTDKPQKSLEGDDVKTKKSPDGQSETSEEGREQLLMENRQNRRRRNRRKAARMAQVRQCFAQRDAEAEDTERSAPEIKQAAEEEPRKEKHADVQSFPGRDSKSDDSQFVSQSVKTCSQASPDDLPDTSPAHDCSSNSQPEKSESAALADSVTDTGGESATDISDKPPSDEPSPAEQQSIHTSVSTAEESSQSSESLVSQSNFTFGTVVAPLYHQLFGRVGSESQRECENPVSVVNLLSERKQNSCTDTPTGGGPDSNHATHNSAPTEEETSLTVTVIDCAENPSEMKHSERGCTNSPECPLLGDTLEHLEPVNIPNESLDLQRERAEEDPTQTQCQHTQIKTNLDETPSQSEAEEVGISLHSSLRPSLNASWQIIEEQNSSGTEETRKNIHASVKEDELFEMLHDLNSNHNNNSLPNEPENCISSCELVKETPETCLETCNTERGNNSVDSSEKHSEMNPIQELVESMIEEAMSDVFVRLNENTERCEEEDEDSCLAELPEEKNWEMMVEEEENAMLTHEEEGEPIKVEAEEATDSTEKKKEEVTAAGAKEAVEEEDMEWIREGEEEEEDQTNVTKTAEIKTTEGPEETELQTEKHFADTQEVIIERRNIQEEDEEEEEEEEEMGMTDEGETGVKSKQGTKEEEIPDYRDEIQADEAGEIIHTTEDGDSEAECFPERSDITQNKHEDGVSAPVNSRQDETVTAGEGGRVHDQTQTCVYEQGDFQSKTHDRSGAEGGSSAAEGAVCVLTDEPENEQTGRDSASAESDSDDEVELYMHCLRAVHIGAQAQKDAGFTVSKRPPPVSRSKLLSTPMPSISESVDEEQHLSDGSSCSLQEDKSQEDVKTAAGQSALRAQEGIRVSWWKDAFSCRGVSKTLLCSTLLVVFLVVAYHYDFLACFGLYLISVVWLCCQGERQPVKNNRMG
ncbi:protein phosphatase 1 regulatory subunit 3A [Parambassis ranga]|uniref:Protein phosphatase 1 regulatory subunit 3A n=1 Tax=Parambassis ranga TaxID=210632 RepID=A0A6P7KHJ7_9TELE|nr:protein phosphatase 1 regulatory subunit 3A-like [Parambassis ranga]